MWLCYPTHYGAMYMTPCMTWKFLLNKEKTKYQVRAMKNNIHILKNLHDIFPAKDFKLKCWIYPIYSGGACIA